MSVLVNPKRLSVFALDVSDTLPLSGLPIYSEVVIRSELGDPLVQTDSGFSDAVFVALRNDTTENVAEPQPKERLTALILEELARQLGPAAHGELGDASAEFIGEVLKAVRTALGGAQLRDIDSKALKRALRKATRDAAQARGMVLQPLPAQLPTSWAYPLGVVATDHVGYASFDLSRLPRDILDAIGAAVEDRRLNPAAALNVGVALYAGGLPSAGFTPIDALAQGRTSTGSILARLELVKADLPDGLVNGGQPAMQNPSLDDWRLSPGSFATNPASFIGADGCESILPANSSLQEFHFYQVVRLTDVSPPVDPITPSQIRLGLVNEYRVAWYPLGHSLGQILYSLPLAPGESVNIAVIDWTRRDEAQRKEHTTVDEQLVHNEHRDRSISETVDAAVREYQHGSTFMGGIAGALGGSTGAVSGGVAGSLGGSTASTSGSRNVTGSTVQQLSDHITQASSASRELQSTVVVQSNQSEKESVQTRTVVNYNHSHALTMLYYEVLRHFRMVTELVRQRPAVLVKVRTDWFDGALALSNVVDRRAVLLQALIDPRYADGFDAADRLVARGGPLTDFVAPLPSPPPSPAPDPNLTPPLFRYFTFEMTTGGFHRAVDDHAAHVDILASLILKGGARVDMVNITGGHVLNNFGAFSQENTNNIFTAIPLGRDTVPWNLITGMILSVVVFPTDGDTAKVSFSHIKVSGIDDGGVPGLTVVDQGYESGHLIITNGNDELNRDTILPTRRPPFTPPPPLFSADDLADRNKVLALVGHLRQHKHFYSRAIVLGQDAFERATELDGIALVDGSTVSELVENRPLEMVGDYLAYPSDHPAWSALIAGSLFANDTPDDSVLDERLITLPSRGVFGEAKLGHCNASEEIDNTRFWDWQQSPIPHMAPEIAPTVPVTPQPVQQGLSPAPFPSSIVNIVSPPAAPDPTGLAGALAVLATPNIFRDLSGQSQVADLLKNLADNAVKVASLTGGGGGGASGASGGTSSGAGSTGSLPARPLGSSATTLGGARAAPNQPSANNRDLQDLGNVLSGAQAKGLITPEAAQGAFTSAASGDPLAETVSNINLVGRWRDLVEFQPPAKLIADLKARSFSVQSVFDGLGDLNTDLYAVRISKPLLAAGTAMTPEAFLEYVRLHINDFVDNSLSTFNPLEPVDAPIWLSANPLGAVIKIDIQGPDNAAVLVSEQDSHHWRFTTVQTPFSLTGTHPVSGNRDFGLKVDTDGWTFYTRGADRATDPAAFLASDILTFPKADQLWRSLQAKMAAYVIANGGAAQIIPPFSVRNPWTAVRTLFNFIRPLTV